MKRFTCLLLTLFLLLSGCTEPQSPVESTTKPVQMAPASTTPESIGELRIDFIDVGQADCALLECNGAYALIDAGNTDDGPAVVEFLQERGVKKLDLLVGTHLHEDHIGGMADVMQNFPAETIWFSHTPYYNSVVYRFLGNADMQGKKPLIPEVGQTFRLGDALITVLGPLRSDYEDVNDLSLVLMVQYGQSRILFTGDMEMEAEIDLVESGADLKADLLKVGHHGSYSSTCYRFLKAVAPTYAVISVGAANEYGLPHQDPLSRLQDAEVTIYRTDKMYTVTAISDGTQIRFSWGNSYAQPWMPAS